MPTYVYRCRACDLTFERQQRMTDACLTECPECGGRVRRVIQPVPIFFKGPGFYVTDNKRAGSTAKMPDNGQEPQGKGSEEQASEEQASEEKTSSPQ
jgi:putative FmdB family regulatory protein